MRNVGIKQLLRYVFCVALFIACDVYANFWQSDNAVSAQKNKKSNVYDWRDADSLKALFSNIKRNSSSIGDVILDDASLQNPGPVGTKTNWDFVTSACLANDNINVSTFTINGSGCGGNITVDGVVHVRACTQDMTVFVTSDTRLVAGTPDAALIIEAALGRTITFNLQENLGFAASATDPLLVVLRGPGTIIFNISDSNVLAFGDQISAGSGLGVNTYIIMEDPAVAGDTPTVIVQRASTSSAAPVDITIGQNSFITYAACTNILNAPDESALLLFDPSNAGIGRMVLTIFDGGNLNISGRLIQAGDEGNPCPLGNVCAAPFDFALGNFNRSTLAGLSAIFGIVGLSGSIPTVPGRMLIINENATAFDFQADPWCTLGTRSSDDGVGCFTGIQYGFVLGANGILGIDAGQTFDYVGLACGVCPDPVVSVCESVTPLPTTCAESPTCTIPQAVSFSSLIKPRNYSAFIVDGFNNPNPVVSVPNAAIIMCECTAMAFRSGVDCCCIVESPRDDSDCSNEFTIPSGKLTPGAGEIVFDVEGLLDVASVDVLAGCGIATPGCVLPPDSCGIPQQAWSAKIELLSLHVCRTGCALLVDHTCCASTNFQRRDFATTAPGGPLLTYNKGEFFINNRVNLQGIALVHTDQNHKVVEKNDVISEPTYVGGESWTFCGNSARPAIAFYNSAFFVHTNVALTGVDLLVPNDNSNMLGHSGLAQAICADLVRQPSPTPVPCCSNTSAFIFFQNGNLVDAGMGRQMILGTNVGAVACDGCTIINADSHLDVKQENPCTAPPITVLQQLLLQTWPNNACINQGIFNGEVVGNIATQPSLHDIFLGNNSNISIGADSNDLAILGISNLTLAQLIIQGNFFSFATRGGNQAVPSLSGVTGQGGIFVDFNGQICTAPTARVVMGDMVTKSSNGLINLPTGQVIFGPFLGIEDWQLDLSNCTQRVVDCNNVAEVVVVPANQNLSNYVLNWLVTTKNFIGGTADQGCIDETLPGFLPYLVTCYSPCTSPAVVAANVQFLPTILGTVDQLQIYGSTLGDEAHVAIRGCGEVRELVNVVGCNAGELPATVVVLGDSGTVGLGDVTLGANGITIIADGPNVLVRLTSDVVIDNIAAILKGPNFCAPCNQPATAECVIRFDSDCCHSVRVKQSGILDLSSFTANNQVVEFGGNARLILEPGAVIAWGGQGLGAQGGTLRFVDQAQLIVESFDCVASLFANNPSSITLTDSIRSKLVGNGLLVFEDCSSFMIEPNAFFGIETLTATAVQQACGVQNSCQVLTTNIALTIDDQASFFVGSGCPQLGGSLQVGNTTNQTGSSVSFALNLSGQDALFGIGGQAFVGFGVGIASKVGAVNSWLVNTLFNLGTVAINIPSGTFRHDRIFTGTSVNASLLALSQGTSVVPATYIFDVTPDENENEGNISTTTIQGGGNLILVEANGGVDISPNVTNVNGVVTPGRLTVGVLASLPLMPQTTIILPFSGTADALVNTILAARDTTNFQTNAEAGLVNVAKSNLHYQALVDYIVGTAPAASTIVRTSVPTVKGAGGSTITFLQATNIGAGRGTLTPNNPLILQQVRVID